MNHLPSVSIVIPTYNEEKNVERCLSSIFHQEYPKELLEVFIVDNYSRDKTIKFAREYNVKIFQKGPERSAQRNFGVEKASGKYILFVDADMILSKKVVKECVNKCENEDYIALYIPEKIIGGRFWAKVRDFERSFYNTTVIDCVRFVRRDKFLRISGFDKNLIGAEDWDFNRRIKETGKVSIIDAPLYHNEEKIDLKKYFKKKGYYLQFIDDYIKKWGKRNPVIKKQLGSRYRLFGVFMENGKWKKLLRHPLLTLGLYFLRFIVGVQYLIRKNKNSVEKERFY